jgi:signal transduction histidine kinase
MLDFVRVYSAPGEVILEVKDEGKGIPLDLRQEITSGESLESGTGMRGIRERLRHFGSRLELQSVDFGTVVNVALPDNLNVASEVDSTISAKQNETGEGGKKTHGLFEWGDQESTC